MKKLTVGSCFAGIGGIELGLERTGGFETKWQIENDSYASAVLAKHWPDAKRYGDIKTVDAAGLGKVDLICGGYPCQPFSFAGKRRGEDDERALWPSMLGIIGAIRPAYVFLENVRGHITSGLSSVLGGLTQVGYDAEWTVIPACSVGATHTRGRLFVLAYPNGKRWPRRANIKTERVLRRGNAAERQSSADIRAWPAEPRVCGIAHGIPSRVDRLRCLGNAVVPQVAEKIGRMILEKGIWE